MVALHDSEIALSIAYNEIKFLGSTPTPSKVSTEFKMRLYVRFLSFEKAVSRGYADSARLARETFAWHKTTLTRFLN